MREQLAGSPASALLLTHLPNIRYLSGFTGSAALLVVELHCSTLITDARYALQASQEVTATKKGARVVVVRKGLLTAAGALIRQRRLRRVGFSPSQLSVAGKDALAQAAGAQTRWVNCEGWVEELRAIKDETEIETMRQAAHLASEVLIDVVGQIKPGIPENDLAAEAEYQMRRKGASGAAFETIVASGERSALPHARPSGKPLGKNELVVIDLGAILGGYCSDLTRTVYLGHAPALIRRWHRAVREAQAAARDTAAAGVPARQVDAAARRVLQGYGLEQLFTHSTGHGLGLEVHEAPRIGRGVRTRLATGNVVTLEPGIYAEGDGGIRIEDDAVVGQNGCEVLTTATQEFIEI